uniref:DUF4743 domain-containing protein n=1 Tax=Oncorhynchus tshawytscha TaxID=74940 RepID=A0A8C8HDA2_ONCTS
MFIFVTGSSRTTFLRFGVGGEQVGRVPCKSGVHFEYISNLFNPPHGGAISLCQKFDSFRRSEAVDSVTSEGRLTDLMPRVCDTPLMCMERSQIKLYLPHVPNTAMKRYGVHINGYCQDKNGELRRWHFSTSTPWTRSTTTFEHLKSCMMVLMSGP